MGARVSSDLDREITHLNVSCFKRDLRRAISLLADCVANPLIDSAELELVKSEQAAENNSLNKDLETTTLEACHFNAFRDHMMG